MLVEGFLELDYRHFLPIWNGPKNKVTKTQIQPSFLTWRATLKSNESLLSANPTPIKALLPWFSILRTKYLEESETGSILFVGNSVIGASANNWPEFLSSS